MQTGKTLFGYHSVSLRDTVKVRYIYLFIYIYICILEPLFNSYFNKLGESFSLKNLIAGFLKAIQELNEAVGCK